MPLVEVEEFGSPARSDVAVREHLVGSADIDPYLVVITYEMAGVQRVPPERDQSGGSDWAGGVSDNKVSG